MKTSLLQITIFFLLSTTLSAQVWCAPGAMWQYYIRGSFPVSGPFGNHQLSFTNTVTINGHIYDQLQSTTQGSVDIYPWTGPSVTVCVRKHNEVIYYWLDGSEDTLADMNAVPGDGWYNYWENDTVPTKNTVIDTGRVTIGNLSIKALFFDSAHTRAFIDGIGYNFDFFYQYFWNYPNTTDVYPWYGHFKCYSDQNGTTYKTDPAWACTKIGTGITELHFDELRIVPNPATSFFTITSSVKAKLSMYDKAGRFVITHDVDQGTQEVNCEELARGIYFLEIKTDSQTRRTKLVLY
jgi:hypothetical protein